MKAFKQVWPSSSFIIAGFSLFLSYRVFLTPAIGGEVWGKVVIEKYNEKGKLINESDNSNAVVFLTGFSEKPEASNSPTLSQKNIKFDKRVMAITAGSAVNFKNEDNVYHNVWSLSKNNTFDLGQFKAPVSKQHVFTDPGLVKVFCNIHPEMISTILVLKNNKYNVTEKDGVYSIKDIPPGSFKIKVWVEGSPPLSQDITVTANSKTEMDFSIKSKLREASKLDKDGNPYDKKAKKKKYYRGGK